MRLEARKRPLQHFKSDPEPTTSDIGDRKPATSSSVRRRRPIKYLRRGSLGDSIACRANYSEKGYFGNVSEHGRQIGEMRSGDCHFEYGSEEKDSGDQVEFFYWAAQPLPPPPPPAPKPTPPGPCGTPGQPLCLAVCKAQTLYCGTLAQPDNYPGAYLTCAAGHTGECVQFSCSPDSYTRPYPRCK